MAEKLHFIQVFISDNLNWMWPFVVIMFLYCLFDFFRRLGSYLGLDGFANKVVFEALVPEENFRTALNFFMKEKAPVSFTDKSGSMEFTINDKGEVKILTETSLKF